jgi:3-methyl-2-oxobutanoate hydroxymethyltransferase
LARGIAGVALTGALALATRADLILSYCLLMALSQQRQCRAATALAGREKAIIKAIADAGVPVMSHVGMCPHFMHLYGGFKLQGRSAEEAMRSIEDGLAIEAAGACGFESEVVPAPVAKAVNDAVQIFTFGIGAGAARCGQLLLGYDLLGVLDQSNPKFTKRYAELSKVAVEALQVYAGEVRAGKFPDAEHAYGMKPEEIDKLKSMLASRSKR